MNRGAFLIVTLLLSLPPWCAHAATVSAEDGASVHPQAATGSSGCIGCHAGIRLDAAHALACSRCHGGPEQETIQKAAHTGLIAKPAHPDHMAAACGSCHGKQVAEAARSQHFTLSGMINSIRGHFGARERLAGPKDIPEVDVPSTPQTLADDMLRRRCLRCHVYSAGDAYSAVTHGTGCSACHLSFQAGKLTAHDFLKPTDTQCLSCHYGNSVGSDYHGRYEHDYHGEYRTPFTVAGLPARPYGVEYHDLAPDIHQQRGLICIDCHGDSGHGSATVIQCASCHGWRPGQPAPAIKGVAVRGSTLVLASRTSGATHAIPPMRDPAHRKFGNTVACQVCHAQWAYNDSTTHLLLSHVEDVEPWERLTVQGCSAIESLLEHNLYANTNQPIAMRDGLSGQSRPGIWLQGFSQRRWEQMMIARDTDGVIKVFRPILDLRLSLVDEDGTAPFDNVSGRDNGLRPYTPHTTGPAGLFYQDRFRRLLAP